MNRIIEVSGTITKKESLISLQADISNNTLCFETAHAFPGYHGIVPEEEVPGSLFLVTKKKYSKEAIMRSAKAIGKSLKIGINMVSARIMLQNNEVFAIRIKGLNNYALLPQIIQALNDEGYRIDKSRNFKEFTSIIQVKKEFLLKESEKGFYHDLDTEEFHYFEMKQRLKWYAFEKAIIDIKYNMPDTNFDAALATFYRASGLVDLVRIYKKNLSLDEMKTIKNKLCEYIRT